MIAVALLVIAGLGTGVFLLWPSGENTDPQGQQGQAGGQPSTSAPTTTEAPFHNPDDELKVADLPGELEHTSHIQTFANVQQSGFLTPEEDAAYEKAKADGARLTSTVLSNGVRAYVYTAATESPKSAAAARKALVALQLQYGMKPAKQSPDKVVAAEIAPEGDRPATLRAHYVHRSTVVRIQVHGEKLEDVRAAFTDVIRLQLAALEATG